MNNSEYTQEHIKAARTVLEATYSEDRLRHLVRAMVQLRFQAEQVLVPAAEDFSFMMDQIGGIIENAMVELYPGFLDSMAPVYCAHLTEADLAELLPMIQSPMYQRYQDTIYDSTPAMSSFQEQILARTLQKTLSLIMKEALGIEDPDGSIASDIMKDEGLASLGVSPAQGDDRNQPVAAAQEGEDIFAGLPGAKVQYNIN